jgi:hypothetical protein
VSTALITARPGPVRTAIPASVASGCRLVSASLSKGMLEGKQESTDAAETRVLSLTAVVLVPCDPDWAEPEHTAYTGMEGGLPSAVLRRVGVATNKCLLVAAGNQDRGVRDRSVAQC